MRVIGDIPHPKFVITVFEWNEKTIIKLEAGPMEQTYKLPSEHVRGVEGAKKLLNEEFLKSIYSRFEQMFMDMQEAVKKV